MHDEQTRHTRQYDPKNARSGTGDGSYETGCQGKRQEVATGRASQIGEASTECEDREARRTHSQVRKLAGCSEHAAQKQTGKQYCNGLQSKRNRRTR
jgi:hypothetical protein